MPHSMHNQSLFLETTTFLCYREFDLLYAVVRDETPKPTLPLTNQRQVPCQSSLKPMPSCGYPPNPIQCHAASDAGKERESKRESVILYTRRRGEKETKGRLDCPLLSIQGIPRADWLARRRSLILVIGIGGAVGVHDAVAVERGRGVEVVPVDFHGCNT